MPDPLLRTKLFVPPLRPNLVSRHHLIERLNQGLKQGQKLTLISAPAGFGKTTLLSEWLNILGSWSTNIDQPTIRFAWLSLDEGDNDLTRFLTYSLTALNELEGIKSAPGQGALSMLHVPQPPPTEVILTSLINDVAQVVCKIVLVLDDYHLIDSLSIDNALTFLLDHLPRQLHLVIATREDPELPLARYRARDEMSELRVAELRFTHGEAANFLNQVMGLNLTSEEVASLGTRTEGWVAGLQLAALSMQDREDVSSFIEAFAGDNRYIVDYLLQEVLQRQPENIRNFLLDTSILDQMSGPLCDAVRFGSEEKSDHSGHEAALAVTPLPGLDGGQVIIEALERGNLFVIPLDDKRQWYRYHHLFAEVLHAHARAWKPERIPILHERASHWYEQNGSRSEAIRHALAANNFNRAARLIELVHPEMDVNLQSAAWLRWAKVLPDELVRSRPVLSMGYAWALLDAGDLEQAEERMQDAERWLERTAESNERLDSILDEMVVVDKEQFRLLPASMAAARAYRALALGDLPGTVMYAEKALGFFPEENHHWRLAASSLLGAAQYAQGELESAIRAFSNFRTAMLHAGNIPAAIGSTFVLAEITVTLGHLREAEDIYQRTLELATKYGQPVPLGTAELYRGIGDLYRQRGELEAAVEHMAKAREVGEKGELLGWRYRLCIDHSRLKESLGDLEGALELLDEAGRSDIRTPIPHMLPVTALKARVWLRQGRFKEAKAWARQKGLLADDELSYANEFEHVTLARVLVADYQRSQDDRPILEAMRLLERLLEAAEAGGRMGSVIEILVIQALAHQVRGEVSAALTPLERALTLAEPEDYAQIFVDEGSPMYDLLSEAAAQGMMSDYTLRLLGAFRADKTTLSDKKGPYRVTSQALFEPLSERELEVLRLVAQGLSNREIGQRLFLAINTIKGHNRRIFSKLQVQNRTEAVARARQLHLL